MSEEQRAIVKLTDAQGRTGAAYDTPLQWGPGVTHTVPLWSGAMCQSGVLHCYEGATVRDALALAILRAPQDGCFGQTARAWVCEGSGRHVTNGIKSGYETLSTVREIPLPEATTEQRVECAIRIAWEVCDDPAWRAWAQAWLDGTDRTEEAAMAARAAARSAARSAAAVAARAADEGVDVAAIAGSVLLPEWTDTEGVGNSE